MDYKDNEFYKKMIQKAIDNSDEISYPNWVPLLGTLVYNEIYDNVLVNQLLSIILRHVRQLSLPYYLEMWNLITTLKIKSKIEFNFLKCVTSLKKVMNESNYWKIKDFSNKELTSILLNFAALKSEDFQFVNKFIKEIFARDPETSFTCEELVMLVRVLYAYSKTFENVFIELHDICERRYPEFNEEEKKLLEGAFRLRRQIIPKRSLFFVS